MTSHGHYREITAETPRDMGIALGRAFGPALRPFLEALPSVPKGAAEYLARCLELTRRLFPDYAAEFEGYAEGAGVPLDKLWHMLLEDDVNALPAEKCTSLVTNNGRLVGHNEDWDPGADRRLFLLRRELRGTVTLELHYAGTPGGNSISISSAGMVQMINSVDAAPLDTSIPRVPTNIVARFLADCEDVGSALERLKTIPRMGGYAHTLVRLGGDKKCHVAELSQHDCAVREIADFPFAHANHYILDEMTRLNQHPSESTSTSRRRYAAASGNASAQMSPREVMSLLDSPDESLMNERTIGGMVLDLDARHAWVRLASEPCKGWLRYDLDFIA